MVNQASVVNSSLCNWVLVANVSRVRCTTASSLTSVLHHTTTLHMSSSLAKRRLTAIPPPAVTLLVASPSIYIQFCTILCFFCLLTLHCAVLPILIHFSWIPRLRYFGIHLVGALECRSPFKELPEPAHTRCAVTCGTQRSITKTGLEYRCVVRLLSRVLRQSSIDCPFHPEYLFATFWRPE